jgi:hypothetical protein
VHEKAAFRLQEEDNWFRERVGEGEGRTVRDGGSAEDSDATDAQGSGREGNSDLLI